MRGRRPDDHRPPAQIKQMFQEGKLKAGDKKTIKEFADYIGHPSDNEMRRAMHRKVNDRKCAQKEQQEYKDIEWEDLYHRNQLPSLFCR